MLLSLPRPAFARSMMSTAARNAVSISLSVVSSKCASAAIFMGAAVRPESRSSRARISPRMRSYSTGRPWRQAPRFAAALVPPASRSRRSSRRPRAHRRADIAPVQHGAARPPCEFTLEGKECPADFGMHADREAISPASRRGGSDRPASRDRAGAHRAAAAASSGSSCPSSILRRPPDRGGRYRDKAGRNAPPGARPASPCPPRPAIDAMIMARKETGIARLQPTRPPRSGHRGRSSGPGTREAGGDGIGVVDGHRFSAQGRDEEAHGDAVVELGGDRPPPIPLDPP